MHTFGKQDIYPLATKPQIIRYRLLREGFLNKVKEFKTSEDYVDYISALQNEWKLLIKWCCFPYGRSIAQFFYGSQDEKAV